MHSPRWGSVAVVHNGIIENFRELRDELAAAFAKFMSETDNETIVHLAMKHLADGVSRVEGAHATMGQLAGAFVLAFLFEGEDNLLIVARRGSPLERPCFSITPKGAPPTGRHLLRLNGRVLRRR